MTEEQWLTLTDRAQMMIGWLRRTGNRTRTKAGKRKFRLLVCGCARHLWPLLTDERARTCVEVAERHVEGLASDVELSAAWTAALPLTYGGYCEGDDGVVERTAMRIAVEATCVQASAGAFNITTLSTAMTGVSINGRTK
jgi:hypothetical protein